METTRDYVCAQGHRHQLTAENSDHKEAAHRSTCPTCQSRWAWSFPAEPNPTSLLLPWKVPDSITG